MKRMLLKSPFFSLRTRLGMMVLSASVYVLAPQQLFAESPGYSEAVAFVQILNEVFIYPLIALLASVALLVFVWGAFEYVMNAENPAGRETGRSHMMYGIVGLVVMVSAFTILSIATNSFGLLSKLQWAAGG